MQDRDWTGTAAAVTALALTAGAWLWPSDQPPHAAAPPHQQVIADEAHRAEDMERWRAEARRWDGSADSVQLSAAGAGEPVPVIR